MLLVFPRVAFRPPRRGSHDSQIVFSQCRRSYWINPRKHPDFFWLFVCRTCYYAGISQQVFLQARAPALRPRAPPPAARRSSSLFLR